MERDADGVVTRRRFQVVVKRLHALIHGGLARAVAVPPAERVVADAADARGERGPGCVVREGSHGSCVLTVAAQICGFLRQEGGEVFEEEQVANCVDLKGVHHLLGIELAGRFLWVQDARECKGEVEVGGRGVFWVAVREEFGTFGCGICDGGLVCGMCLVHFFRP